MLEDICRQAEQAAEELIEKAKLHPGQIVVIGCSTSEICGSRIGTDSQPGGGRTGRVAVAMLSTCCTAHGVELAAQCCEHLNRAHHRRAPAPAQGRRHRERCAAAEGGRLVRHGSVPGVLAIRSPWSTSAPTPGLTSAGRSSGCTSGRSPCRFASAARSHRAGVPAGGARHARNSSAVSAPSTIRTCCKKEKNQGLFRELWNRPVFMPPAGGHGYDNRYARPFRFQWQRNTRRPSLRPRPSGCFRGGRSGP